MIRITNSEIVGQVETWASDLSGLGFEAADCLATRAYWWGDTVRLDRVHLSGELGAGTAYLHQCFFTDDAARGHSRVAVGDFEAVVDGCVFLYTGANVNAPNYLLYVSGSGVRVTNNVIAANFGQTINVGVRLYGTYDAVVTDNVLRGFALAIEQENDLNSFVDGNV